MTDPHNHTKPGDTGNLSHQDTKEERVAPTDWNDDVTPEGVAKMRELAAPFLEGADLEVIDGFGRKT